jgi:rod shape-determining protein MreC
MRNKRLFVLMIGLIVFIAVMGFSLGERKNLSWPEKFINDSVSFVQQWFYKPAGYMAGLFQDVREMRDIYVENEQLRIEVARAARDAVKLNKYEKENERLKEELGFTEEQKRLNQFTLVIAQVVAVSQDPLNRAIKIDLGSKDGIKKEMAVVTVDGLVGLVDNVYPFYSTVMPITELDEKSPDSRAIAATALGRDDSFGIVDSYNKQTGMLMMTKIPENDKLTRGDQIITSGLGNVFPYGLVIGTVQSKQVGDFGLTYVAQVKPAADIDKLTEVFVVKVPEIGAANP